MRRPREHTIHQSHQECAEERSTIIIKKFTVALLYRSGNGRRGHNRMWFIDSNEDDGALMQGRLSEGT